MMIKMLSQEDFLSRVQKLYMHHYDTYTFKPCDLAGIIYPKRSEEMLDFCRHHPEFHVVSGLTYHLVNRYVPNAHYYYLAFGDQNPALAMPALPTRSISDKEPLSF